MCEPRDLGMFRLVMYGNDGVTYVLVSSDRLLDVSRKVEDLFVKSLLGEEVTIGNVAINLAKGTTRLVS